MTPSKAALYAASLKPQNGFQNGALGLTPKRIAANVTALLGLCANPLMENLFRQKMMSISGVSNRLSCVVLAALVSACVSAPEEAKKTALISEGNVVAALPSAPEARLTLTIDALRALQDAEAVVAKAAAVYALWPIASEKIAAARIAAKRFNSAAVVLYANQAQELAQLGLKQKTYPMISITNQPKGT